MPQEFGKRGEMYAQQKKTKLPKRGMHIGGDSVFCRAYLPCRLFGEVHTPFYCRRAYRARNIPFEIVRGESYEGGCRQKSKTVFGSAQNDVRN